MMYRRNSARTPRVDHRKAAAGISFADAVRGAVVAMLDKIGVYAQAQRENRKRDRGIARQARHTTFHAFGLNGARAVARRRRQIERGQLTGANGLVA